MDSGRFELISNIYNKKFCQNHENKDKDNLTLDKLIIKSENTKIFIASLLTLFYIISLSSVYALFDVISKINIILWIFMIVDITVSIILLLYFFTCILISENNYLNYLLYWIFTFLPYFLFLNSIDLDIPRTKKSLLIIIEFGMFFLVLQIFNYFKLKLNNEIKRRQIQEEGFKNIPMRYIDSLINNYSCLYFTWSQNNFFFINKTSRLFLENKFNSLYKKEDFIDFEEIILDKITKCFFSSLKFTYLQSDVKENVRKINFSCEKPLIKIIEFYKNNDFLLENYIFNFLGTVEYFNVSTGEKFFFNFFIRKIEIGNSKWIEVMMYDISITKKIEAVDNMLKLKEKILSKIAHEFKTPLICIISLTEEIKNTLKNKKLNEKENIIVKKKISHVNDLSNYTLLLLNDITQYLNRNTLKFNYTVENICPQKVFNQTSEFIQIKEANSSKIKNILKPIFLNIQEVNVKEFIKFSYRILKTLLTYNKNKIQFIKPYYKLNSSAKNLQIRTDPLRLKQILLNLISNSVNLLREEVLQLRQKLSKTI